METSLALRPEVTRRVAQALNIVLADEYVFLTKLLKYHWNIAGPHFFTLHKLLDVQYREVFDIIDEVAERVRSLGHFSLGTLHEFSSTARIKEQPGHIPVADQMLADLVRDHETIIATLRSDIPWIEENGDFGTMDFLTKIMEQHEKMAWFIRAHLQ